MHGIVHSHGGHITISSGSNQGTEICVYFPFTTVNEQANPKLDSPDTQQFNVNNQNNGNRILIVDDEETLLGLFQSLLEDNGYEVIATSDSANAVDITKNQSETLSLLITDQVMPGMNGTQIAKVAKDAGPELPVFLCSGFSDLMERADDEEVELDASFTKPIDSKALISKIKEPVPQKPLSH